MNDQALLINVVDVEPVSIGSGMLRQEYQTYQNLFQAQPPVVKQYLNAQASALAEAIIKGSHQAQFTLPDRVEVQTEGMGIKTVPLPADERGQQVGGFVRQFLRSDLRTALRLRFLELEHSINQAVSTGSVLLRHALAMHMVYNMLPSGKTVFYEALEGEEIPSIPVKERVKPRSEFTANSDSALIERGQKNSISEEVQVPYVEAARYFYLPQWVTLDDGGHLLVGSLAEAEADIASMQHYLSVLHTAVGLAPYMVADEQYQHKRYGMLGQLVNQGRALANFEVEEIVRTIQRRAADHELDRGLSLSVPYFNDQTLTIETFRFDVIPSGRVMFVPAFVVLAVRAQGAKVAQDTRLDHSTRRHLLAELGTLEKVFLR